MMTLAMTFHSSFEKQWRVMSGEWREKSDPLQNVGAALVLEKGSGEWREKSHPLQTWGSGGVGKDSGE